MSSAGICVEANIIASAHLLLDALLHSLRFRGRKPAFNARNVVLSLLDQRQCADILRLGMPAPRRPTPPKHNADKAIEEALTFLDTSDEAIARSSLATPPTSSPHKSSEHEAIAKKIRFDSDTTCIDEALLRRPICGNKLSRARKPTRSILKLTDEGAFNSSDCESNDGSPRQPITVPEMIEAAVKQLASGITSSKTDAYRMLLSCLKTCEDAPERQLLLQKLPTFEDSIKRDLREMQVGQELSSKGLALSALKLSAALFSDEFDLHEALSNDYLEWLYEDTFALLGSPTPNKERAKNQLILFTYPRFCSRVFTPDRSNKILHLSLTIHQRISGTAIQVLRLMIMIRLLERQQPIMLSNVRRWLPFIFHGLLSSSKELRTQAINLGQRASDSLGLHKAASFAVLDFLNLETRGSTTNFDLLEQKLDAALKPKDKDPLALALAREVPRIWSSIVMFLRGSRQRLQAWPYLPRWLHLIQWCFNTSSDGMQAKAFVAWNHFIVALQPGLETPASVRDQLILPISQYLQRQSKTEAAVRGRYAALSSFRLILFYEFRPDAPPGQWTAAWKRFVAPSIERFAREDPAFIEDLSNTFVALFNLTERRIWNKSLVSRRTSTHPFLLLLLQ